VSTHICVRKALLTQTSKALVGTITNFLRAVHYNILQVYKHEGNNYLLKNYIFT